MHLVIAEVVKVVVVVVVVVVVITVVVAHVFLPNEIDAIFAAIENSPGNSAHAVVNGDGVIVRGTHDGLPVGEKAERVDTTFVRAKHFGDPQTANRIVSQMHCL